MEGLVLDMALHNMLQQLQEQVKKQTELVD
jgi:hypothetical protein